MADWLPSGPNIPVGALVNAPPRWRDFLERRPDLACSPRQRSGAAGAFPSTVAMTAARFLRLSQVQTGVNARIKYRRDIGDRWEVADTEGDCEDFALAKMVRLLGYGWPRGALRLTLCAIVTPMRWQAHAVLQIETDHGTWVLDNRMKYPRLWTRMIGYRWLWRERPGSEKWEKLTP